MLLDRVSTIVKREVWETTYDSGTILQFAIGTILVFVMCPGLAYLYSGLARRKSALSMIWVVFMATMVGIFQWYFWGYSLAFSSTATNKFIGNLHNFGYQHMYVEMGGTNGTGNYPEIAFANFQGMFLCVTLAILVGAVAERGRLFTTIIFSFIWATLVYCPLACWAWSANGWAINWGVLDYAGGGPVEIGSGVGGFVYSIFLGQRKERLLINFRPHNVSLVTIGTTLLWTGWMAFNGFTAVSSAKVFHAIMSTNLAAAFGGFSWCVMDWRMERKWSTVALCSGCISGLVAATPASGCITLYGSVVLGITAGVVCNFATKLKYLVEVDDSLDILAEHGIAGILGLFFNALFGDATVIGLDGITEHDGGFITHNWKQIYIQIAYIAACIGYTAVVTGLICFVLNMIPGLQLRATEEGEEKGMDEDQVGEFAYDYVEVRRDYLDWGVNQQQTAEPTSIDEVVGVAHDTSSNDDTMPKQTHDTNEEKQH